MTTITINASEETGQTALDLIEKIGKCAHPGTIKQGSVLIGAWGEVNNDAVNDLQSAIYCIHDQDPGAALRLVLGAPAQEC